MNTITNNSTSQGVHRGIWIGGGLMALTIVALATTLVVKSNHSDTQPTDALVANPAAASSAPMDATTQVAQAPVVAPVPVPARGEHHAPARHEHNGSNGAGSDGASGGGSSYTNESNNGAQQVASVPVCATCGVIDSYSAVVVQGQNNGVGAVAGGVGGAVIGSKIAGRGNHTLGGIIGAVGGGLLGNAVESHERKSTAYDVRVRMNDGSIRTVRQATIPTVGTHVRVEGNTLAADQSQG
jgi:outer membrane lipoprotein SlyB